MNPKSILLILAATLGVLAVVFVTRSYLSGVRQQAQQVEATQTQAISAKVLVATKNLPAGTILKAEDVAWANWPQDAMSEAYFDGAKDKLKDVTGKVLRTAVRVQSPLAKGALVAPGDRGFLAAALAPGMRAVAVKVSAETSSGGFLFTGDRVDVILTHVVGEGRTAKVPVSETVFQNVRVLAVDQRIDDDSAQVKVGKTVTLEVTPKMAEKLPMIDKIGTLSLSLRSLALNAEGQDIDTITPPIDRTTSVSLGSDISKFLPAPGQAAESDRKKSGADSVVVHRGTVAQEVETKANANTKGDAQ